jgi:hypothetical protein
VLQKAGPALRIGYFLFRRFQPPSEQLEPVRSEEKDPGGEWPHDSAILLLAQQADRCN